MTRYVSRLMLVVVGLLLASLFVWSAESMAQSVSGRAFNLKVNDNTINDTGELPSNGGTSEKSTQSVSLMGLSAKVLYALTTGSVQNGRGTSFSEAAVNSLDLVIPVPNGTTAAISADFIDTQASANCTRGRNTVLTGDAFIDNLKVNGQTVATSNPNATINQVPGVTIVVNEQVKSRNSITVNGLHVTVKDPKTGLLVSDIVVNSARAGANCAR